MLLLLLSITLWGDGNPTGVHAPAPTNMVSTRLPASPPNMMSLDASARPLVGAAAGKN
jgi:hypothetical protein